MILNRWNRRYCFTPLKDIQKMTKRFRFRLSLPSLQMCRTKETSSLPHSPLPISFMFSPVNHKAFDILYTNFPEPPPSTPDQPLCKCDVPSKIMPVSRALRSRSCSTYMSRLSNEDNSYSKVYNSPVSDYADNSAWPIAHSEIEKNKKKDSSIKKSKAGLNMSTSAENTGWFSSDEHNEETESLISSSSSFSSSYDSGNTSQPFNGKPIDRNRRKKNNGKVQRSSLKQLMPNMEDGKVNESYAVVKRSKTPYEDFNRSMMEMILEKQMFEARDLEQLLYCFLSLNSQQHHEAIVDAFTEVWDALFPPSPKRSTPCNKC